MEEFILSDNEYEIMSLLWEENKPLSKADIIKLSPNRSWSESSIYILLNSMLKKGAIIEDGFVKKQTNYTRIFAPRLSEVEYSVMQINFGNKKRKLSVSALVSGLIQNTSDISEILELEKIIQKKIKDLE